MPEQEITVEIGDVLEEDEDEDVAVVEAVGEGAVRAHRLRTTRGTCKWQEAVEEWHPQG